MLAYAAEVADTVRDAGRYDVGAELLGLRWAMLRDRVFERIDAEEAKGRAGRAKSDFVTVYPGHARFLGPTELQIELGGESVAVEADQIVIAAGGRPVVPPPVIESGLPYETSDTIMRIKHLPRRLAVLGGGYVAAELAQVFAAAGTEVVIVEQAERLLGPQDESLGEAFTELARDRFVVDKYQRTGVDGVYALGDVCSAYPLKHVANREAEVVAHNLRHPGELRATDHGVVPAAVFTNPQIASVGATERDCRDAARNYGAASVRYADVAYGWAMEDTTGFCKVLADRDTGRLLGAHIMGPQAATLIQPLVMAMTLDIDTQTLAECPYWIHPALTEVISNALRQLAGQ